MERGQWARRMGGRARRGMLIDLLLRGLAAGVVAGWLERFEVAPDEVDGAVIAEPRGAVGDMSGEEIPVTPGVEEVD